MRALPLLLALSGVEGLLAACAAPPERPAPFERPPAAWRGEAERIVAELEAKFYEHWGSVEGTEPYRRLKDDHLPWLLRIVDENGDSALMALRIIARRWPVEAGSDERRAILYAEGLRRERNFRRWGSITGSGFLPGVYGHELLALKRAAVPYVRKLLADTRRAQVAGGNDERTSEREEWRVCDYAWVFLAAILDRPLAWSVDPRDRDPQIRRLDESLGP